MLRTLAQRGVVRAYDKKAILINEGDQSDSVYVLLKGSVKVFSMDANGREITYGTIQAGEYFGEMSLDGGPRSASVIALEPCTCAMLTSHTLRGYLAAEPQFAIELMEQVIRRARAATQVARSLALLDVYGRLAGMLQQGLDGSHYASPPSHSGPSGSLGSSGYRPQAGQAAGAALLVPHVLENITHQDIAGRIGASREVISRILKDLERGGYLILSTKRITLLKKLPERY